jgi:hypothetical protein
MQFSHLQSEYLTRARIRAPFDGKIILLKQKKITTLEVQSIVCRKAARGWSYPC